MEIYCLTKKTTIMANLEVKESAEGTSRSLIGVVYYFNLILGIIAFLVGIVMVLDGEEVGLYPILVAIIFIFWLTLLKALFDTFVNISVKLDKTDSVIRELESIEQLLVKINDNLKSPKLNEQVSSPASVQKNDVEKEELPSVFEKEKVESVKSTSSSEIENRIIDTIVAGNEMDARLMLMQNKGLSLTAAISYINDIKGKLK